MSNTTIRKLAALIQTPPDRLMAQLSEAGLLYTDPDQVLTALDKVRLLGFLKRGPGRAAQADAVRVDALPVSSPTIEDLEEEELEREPEDEGLVIENPFDPEKIKVRTVSRTVDARIMDDVSRSLKDQVDQWMQVISPGSHIEIELVRSADLAIAAFKFDRDGDIPTRGFRATNVGFGLSYALPVVFALVSAKPGSLVIIENPEAHLHPFGQTRLGQLASRAAAMGPVAKRQAYKGSCKRGWVRSDWVEIVAG